MSNIKIDHEQVKALAQTYDDAEAEIETMLSGLKKTQTSLEAIWEGKAWTEFNATYKEFEPKVKDFGEFLGSVGDQLKENARVMREADEALEKANKLK